MMKRTLKAAVGLGGPVIAVLIGCASSDGNGPSSNPGQFDWNAGGQAGAVSRNPAAGSTSYGGYVPSASGGSAAVPIQPQGGAGGLLAPGAGGSLPSGGEQPTGGVPGAGGVDVGAGGAGVGGSVGGCCAGCLCRASTEPQASDLDKAGPYQSGTFTVPRGTNFGGATVYYPTGATPPFAYAAFCPPYTATQIAFAAWGPFFASHGIVLATMDSVTTGDYPPQRAQGLEELMGILKAENSKAGSPLMGKLDPDRGGVLGWSMGGGGVWIASGKHPEWKSAITLAGHNITATGWQASAQMSTVPTMMLNGATDTTILGGMNQTQNAYATIPATTPKLMYIMSDLGHFDWGTPTAEKNAAGRYVMAWEHTFLEGDARYRKFLLEKGPNASTWQSNLQ